MNAKKYAKINRTPPETFLDTLMGIYSVPVVAWVFTDIFKPLKSCISPLSLSTVALRARTCSVNFISISDLAETTSVSWLTSLFNLRKKNKSLIHREAFS